MTIVPFLPERLARAKASYTTHLVRPESMAALLVGPGLRPEPGDLVLARVESIGQHKSLERPDGRKAALFCGDEVIVAYGHRYAPDQYEAEVPADLGPCHLVAAGGIAARILSAHVRMKQATSLQPLGLVADHEGRRANLGHWRLPAPAEVDCHPVTIAVVGTSMNAGKTTSAAFLVKGLVDAGLSVGAAKVTGTGAGGDVWLLRDAGANPVFDFTHAGHATTSRCDGAELGAVVRTLTGELASSGVDVAVLEIADGMFQRETAMLLDDPMMATVVDGYVFAAADAVGAVAGAAHLRSRGAALLAVSGLVTASPLGTREARAALGATVVLDPVEISHPVVAEHLLAEARCSRIDRQRAQLLQSA